MANGFRGKVDLIYIDPPFDSGADYVRRVELRGIKGTARLDGAGYTLGEQIQYTDIWANDNYLQFMYERLLLLRELLAPDGSLYLHSDVHRSHHLRCLLEEVFGAANMRNEIIWKRFNFRADGKKFGTVHDTIFLVTRGSEYHFDKPFVDLNESYIRSHFRRDAADRLFRLDNLTAPAHGKAGKALRFGKRLITPPPGTMWRHAQEGLDELWQSGLIVIPDGGVPQVIRYLDEIEGQAVHSLWTDIFSINSQSGERSELPAQKPEACLNASSQPHRSPATSFSIASWAQAQPQWSHRNGEALAGRRHQQGRDQDDDEAAHRGHRGAAGRWPGHPWTSTTARRNWPSPHIA